MMNSKTDKVNLILNLASGKPHQVLKARPALRFSKHSHDDDLYRCETTGELLTAEEINSRYEMSGRLIDGVPRITGFLVYEVNQHSDSEVSVIWLLPVEKDEIIFNQ